MAGNGDNTKAATGIAGLDDVLRGGFPADRVYLIQGDPGSGKTTLGLQFLLEGHRKGESGMYVSLSETRDEIVAVARSHDWSLDGIRMFEMQQVAPQLSDEAENTLFEPSEVELREIMQRLLGEIEQSKASRVVFDSLSELRLLAQHPLRYRRQILMLKQFFAGRQCTVLFLDDGRRPRTTGSCRASLTASSCSSSRPPITGTSGDGCGWSRCEVFSHAAAITS